MKKKRFNLSEQYKKSWDYIVSSRRFIYISIFVFFVFALVGFFVPAPEFLSNYILDYFKELLLKTEGFGVFEWVGFIFLNNSQSSFLSLFFGLVLGIYPLLGSIVNGYLLGFIASMSVNQGGILSLWRVLPHGIFELPAIFISFGLGIKLGMFIFEKDKIKTLRSYLINSFRVFLYVVLPLLIIAAIIEGILIFFGS